MKKILFLILFAGSALSSLAYDYPYLAFQTSNGSVTTVAVESLTLTVSGSSLVATNDDGSVTLSLSDLSKMYFTTEAATGISNVSSNTGNEVDVYTIAGIYIGRYSSFASARDRLGSGVYIVKSESRTQKITVK